MGSKVLALLLLLADSGGLPPRVVRLWAVKATASTEYSSPDWAALQATGPPDTPAAGDHTTAWASREEDAGDEWLELHYAEALYPTLVRIHETFNPGAVVKVEARDPRGAWQTIWEGRPPPAAEKIRWFEVRPVRRVITSALRLTLDSRGVPGWNEIDAVELVGHGAAPR